jgi:hypothetical protein
MNLSTALSTVVLLTPAAVAQCPFATVVSQAYGSGCNPVFGTNPALAVTLNPASCTVDITVSAFSGCCNTFLSGRVLCLGVVPVSVPLPNFGVGCTLLAQPDFLLLQPTASGATFVLPLPAAGIPPLTFFAQGGALYFTTIGLSTDLAFTDGAQVTLG